MVFFIHNLKLGFLLPQCLPSTSWTFLNVLLGYCQVIVISVVGIFNIGIVQEVCQINIREVMKPAGLGWVYAPAFGWEIVFISNNFLCHSFRHILEADMCWLTACCVENAFWQKWQRFSDLGSMDNGAQLQHATQYSRSRVALNPS